MAMMTMKKVLLALILAATSLVTVGSPAQAAAYDGDTFAELIQDPTLHNEHSIVIRFYAAVFARTPDNGGIRFWLDQYDTGLWSTRRIANFFVTSDEFVSLYGAGTTNAQFVDAVYPNVLGRQPDAGGRSFWIGYLDEGNSRAEMILLVSNSPEFINANPLPSDGRPIPAPVDALEFFDDLVRLNGSPGANANQISRGTFASLYAAYVQTAYNEFGVPTVTRRTIVRGGVEYRFDNGTSIFFTNVQRDASGRIANFQINTRRLDDISVLSSAEAPDLGLGFGAYQLVTSGNFTAIRILVVNGSAFDREIFPAQWVFNSPVDGPLSPFDQSSATIVPAGGTLDVIALFDGPSDPVVGGSVDLDVFFEDSGSRQARTITVPFE